MSENSADQLASASPNFWFLRGLETQLIEAAVFAEQHVSRDPAASLWRLRQFGEMLAQEAAAVLGVPIKRAEKQHDLLRRLDRHGALPRDVADLFDDLREKGNKAVHKGLGDRATALAYLRKARTLAVWYVRSFGHAPTLNVGRFIPPPDPDEPDTRLTQELERPRIQLAEAPSIQLDAQHGAGDQGARIEDVARQAYADSDARPSAYPLTANVHSSPTETGSAWTDHLESLHLHAASKPQSELDALAHRASSAGQPEFLDLPEPESLTSEQRDAVESPPGYLRVVAGPGSGKTRALTERIRNFVAQGWFAPRQILAVTFTVKAAQEMRSRLRKRLPDRAQGITIKTLHGLALSIVRLDPRMAGMPEAFDIGLDDHRRNAILDKALNRLQADPSIPLPLKLPEQALVVIARLKHTAPFRLIENDGTPEVRLCQAFDEIVRSAGAVSFDDLSIGALRLLTKSPQHLAAVQNRYRAVFVDECQDLDATQFHLVRKIAEGHGVLTFVGDDDQCIYGWRGADPKYLRDFEKHFPESKSIILQRNHRSTKILVEAARAVIDHNHDRIPKKLTAAPGRDGPRIRIRRFAERCNEVSRIICDINRLIQSGERPRSIAVLARNNDMIQAAVLEARAQGVPVHATNVLRSNAGADLLNLMKTVGEGPGDRFFQAAVNIGRRRIKKSVFRELAEAHDGGLPPEDIERLLRAWAQSSTDDNPTIQAVLTFLSSIDMARSRLLENKPADVLFELATQLELKTPTPETGERDDLSAAVFLALEVARRHGNAAGLDAWMDVISELDEIRVADESFEEAISALTLHRSKGLEFDHVYIMGVQGDILPNLRYAEAEPTQMEAERRLFYVGMTRARHSLTISNHAKHRAGDREGPDRDGFLRELPSHLTDEDV